MHKAKYCVISCIDFRFQSKVLSWLHENCLVGESDLIFVAGSSKDLIKPADPSHYNAFLRQLNLSIKLHDPDEIIIIDHQDCGGYAADGTIPSGIASDKDLELHKVYALQALSILTKLFPSKSVKTYYVGFDKAELIPLS